MKTKKYYILIKIWKFLSYVNRINLKITLFILFRLHPKSNKNLAILFHRPILILITKIKRYIGQLAIKEFNKNKEIL
jgi:hypothetical protein